LKKYRLLTGLTHMGLYSWRYQITKSPGNREFWDCTCSPSPIPEPPTPW